MTMAPERIGTTWDAELNRMEEDLSSARSLIAERGAQNPAQTDDGPAVPWTPPATLGPLPEDLLPRAVAVIAAQRDVADALTRALSENTRQRDFAAKVTGATVTPAAPAYLDVSA